MTLIEQFDDILAKLKAVGIDALIAGGAVRDYILLRDVKDIDVSVAYREDIAERLAEAFGEVHVETMIAAEYLGERGEVKHVYEITSTPTPVQIIVLAPGLDPLDRAKHHDFGICQCWYTGKGQWASTLAFVQDQGLRRFTLAHCEDKHEFERSMRRWSRFKRRFSDFCLHIPAKYMQYEEVFA